jgi:hypothetical protein
MRASARQKQTLLKKWEDERRAIMEKLLIQGHREDTAPPTKVPTFVTTIEKGMRAWIRHDNSRQDRKNRPKGRNKHLKQGQWSNRTTADSSNGPTHQPSWIREVSLASVSRSYVMEIIPRVDRSKSHYAEAQSTRGFAI